VVTYLLDTDVVSNLLRPLPSIALMRQVGDVATTEQCISSITVGELMFGAHRAEGRTAEIVARIEQVILPNLEVLPFDGAAARIYGELRADLERRGVPIGDADTRIAAIALVRSLTVVTGNVRHFERVPGLEVENWLR
jgi:predicted nucleic acid-binding protein